MCTLRNVKSNFLPENHVYQEKEKFVLKNALNFFT